MADDRHHHHHHHHRPNRISVPTRATTIPTTPSATTSRPYPAFPNYAPPTPTPTPTPSKHRLSSLSTSFKSSTTNSKTTFSLSFLFLLLFSLRSLYSLLPFLRSSPSSFSIFPFSFLVSLLSFFLTLSFSLFTSSSSSKTRFQTQSIFSVTLLTQSQLRLLLAKSALLAVVFLLRFQALLYCGTAAMILAELSGNFAARVIFEGKAHNVLRRGSFGSSEVRGFLALFLGLFLLSFSWDRIECFPFSSVNWSKLGHSMSPKLHCVRIGPMLLPFLSGFLGCYERVSMDWATVRELGRKRVRLITLFFTTVVLFIPAVVSMFVFEAEGDSISIGNLGWPLANTVVFGVLLSENYTDEKLAGSKDFQKEFVVTFLCTLVLELFYFPELSLWGLLICGLLLWIAVRELDPVYSYYVELGLESSDSLTMSIMKPIRHILTERKSRKIALFLLINAAYMVVEFVAGFMSNSLGLISDACHMLFDCAALAIGLYASYISRLPANSQFTYGRGRFEVLSGYVNAVFLVLVGALIVLESFERILDPQEISTSSLLVVSVGGLVVNVVGLIFFHEEHHHAHGGSGSCSHSHSHAHSHSPQHHHDHDRHRHNEHDHKDHGKHQECVTVVHDCHEKSSSCLEHSHCNEHQSSVNKESHNSKDIHYGYHHQHDDHHHVHGSSDHHHPNHSEHNVHGSFDHHHHDHSDHQVHRSSNHQQHDLTDHRVYGSHDHHHHCTDHHGHGHTHGLDHIKVSSTREERQGHYHHHHIDHNMEGIFLHVLADTMGSVGVVISTLLIKYKGWLVADPACSIFISVLIVSSVIPLLRNSAEILLQRVPRAHEQDLKHALRNVMRVKGVTGIRSLHVWSFTNTEVVGTIHLQVSGDADKASAKSEVLHLINEAGIKDCTIQIECLNGK